MEVLERIFSFDGEAWYVSLICLLCPVIIYYLTTKLRRQANPDKETTKQYTACDSPECIRCNKCQVIRSEAFSKLCDFAETNNISKGLERVLRAVENREHCEHRHPKQKPNVVYVPGLKAVPWWDYEPFQDDVNTLKGNTNVIFSEYLQIYEDLLDGNVSGWARNTTSSGQWNVFYFYNQGQRNVQNCIRCPKTSAVLDKLHNLMRYSLFLNVSYSVLHAGTKIDAHYGPTNTRIRCHLGLDVPNGCTFTVCDVKRFWQKGKCLIFDDSFLHSAENSNKDANRVVLLLDFWHPQLTNLERRALSHTF